VRVVVTGATGFVGGHLLAALRAAGHEPVALGGPHDPPPAIAVDLLDSAAVRDVVAGAAPDAIVHLAAKRSFRSASSIR